MNIGSICNIPICKDVVDLFIYIMPELGVLYKNNLKDVYILPDVVYTGSDYKKAEFQSLFGPTKELIYYYFFQNFSDAVKEGGWCKLGNNQLYVNPELVDNNHGRYVRGAINRYALFFENSEIYTGDIDKNRQNNIVLFDQLIEDIYTSSTCIIVNNSNNYPNVLVKEYELFQPLSFHSLDKNILGEIYDEKNANKYTIV
jgi:hypothetical protein